MPVEELHALVLAGGASRRLGQDKALVVLNQVPLIRRTIRALQSVPGVAGIIVVGRENLPFTDEGVCCVADDYREAGPLGGLLAGLRHAAGRHCLTVGCDMPFLSTKLLAHLVDLAPVYDAVVPRWEDRPQPLCAVYSPAVRQVGEECLVRGAGSLQQTIRSLERVHWVPEKVVRHYDPVGGSFFNVNTVDDLAKAEAWAGSRT